MTPLNIFWSLAMFFQRKPIASKLLRCTYRVVLKTWSNFWKPIILVGHANNSMNFADCTSFPCCHHKFLNQDIVMNDFIEEDKCCLPVWEFNNLRKVCCKTTWPHPQQAPEGRSLWSFMPTLVVNTLFQVKTTLIFIDETVPFSVRPAHLKWSL